MSASHAHHHHNHGHDHHDHSHHDHAHKPRGLNYAPTQGEQALPPATIQSAASLLLLGSAQRIAITCIFITILWAATAWALA